MIVLSPFFQAAGYYDQIGIIDQSNTYVFFYAMPIIFILLFFLPIAHANQWQKVHTAWKCVWFFVFGLMSALSGPLHLGILPLLIGVVIVRLIWIRSVSPKVQKRWYFSLDFMAVLLIGALWSYAWLLNYLSGTMAEHIPSLAERFHRMFEGCIPFFTLKAGLPWLWLLLTINIFWMAAMPQGAAKPWSWVLAWLVLSCIYVLMLPFGGYRYYRPAIIRYDTFMPVLLGLILVLGRCFLWNILHTRQWPRWILVAVVFQALVYFTQKDKLKDDSVYCEQAMLYEIYRSTEPEVIVSKPCGVVSWDVITDPNGSQRQMVLLEHWGIAKTAERYYFKETHGQ